MSTASSTSTMAVLQTTPVPNDLIEKDSVARRKKEAETATWRQVPASGDTVRELQQSGHAMFVRKRGSPFPVMPAAFFGVRRDDEAEVAASGAAAASQQEQHEPHERAEDKLAASRVYWTARPGQAAQGERDRFIQKRCSEAPERGPHHASLTLPLREMVVLLELLGRDVCRVVARDALGAVSALALQAARSGDGDEAATVRALRQLVDAPAQLPAAIVAATAQLGEREGGDSAPAAAIDRAHFDELAPEAQKQLLRRHLLFELLRGGHFSNCAKFSHALVYDDEQKLDPAALFDLLTGPRARLSEMIRQKFFSEEDEAGQDGGAGGGAESTAQPQNEQTAHFARGGFGCIDCGGDTMQPMSLMSQQTAHNNGFYCSACGDAPDAPLAYQCPTCEQYCCLECGRAELDYRDEFGDEYDEDY